MTVTTTQTQACFDAWIKCENLLTSIAGIKHSFSKRVTKTVDECALICMGTFHAIKSYSPNIQNFALLCVGICEECAEICEMQQGESFKECARICRECSRSIGQLAA
ncbi:MAG TPA: hypothetical protein VHK91_12060 [Flavisolibacter sp.]|jgi:hypothetical protein|nr:hypothetical protein [Flavisolibacter sp.]